MQEEVDEKTMALVISGGKISAGILKDALARYVRHVEERRRLTRTEKRAERAAAERAKENEFKPGKKSLNSMMKEGSQLTNIEITDKNIRSFEKVARKYSIDYSLKKDKSVDPPMYLVFFKARDASAMMAAFNEYSAKILKKDERPSVIEALRKLKEKVAEVPGRIREKIQERGDR